MSNETSLDDQKAIPASAHSPVKNHADDINQTPPGELSGMELAFALYKLVQGPRLVGSPSAGFAYFDDESDALVVVCEKKKQVRYVSLEHVMNKLAMNVAKENCASFVASDTEVICVIGNLLESGRTYGEATLRALLASRRAES